jgi:HSP20 family protein
MANATPEGQNQNKAQAQTPGQSQGQGQAQTQGQTQTQTSAPPSNAPYSASSSTQSTQRDQERAIDTSRDVAMRSAGRRGMAPAVRGTTGISPFLPNPFSLMRRMAEDMDRVLQDLTLGRTTSGQNTGLTAPIDRDLFSGPPTMAQTAWVPVVETFRRGDKIVVRAELPGLRKEDVNVEVDNGILVISGERSDENEEERDGFYRSERVYGQFYRAIPIPEGVNADQVEASFKDGVLELAFAVPKTPDRKTQVKIR